MIRNFFLSIIIFLLFNSFVHAYNFESYSRILKKHLYPGRIKQGIGLNAVDYKALNKEKNNRSSDYSKTLNDLANFNPGTLGNRNEKIAFWINVYNIGAIKMILDHYPVGSIRSMKISFLKNPWNKKIIEVNHKKYSLSYIEHGILLGRYGKKSAHFGIVCASVSCPDLSKNVYRGSTLNRQLNQQGRLFFKNRKKGIYINKNNKKVVISKIFKYDKKSFGKGKSDIIPFVVKFIDNKEDRDFLRNENYDLEYLPYNWNLNSR